MYPRNVRWVSISNMDTIWTQHVIWRIYASNEAKVCLIVTARDMLQFPPTNNGENEKRFLRFRVLLEVMRHMLQINLQMLLEMRKGSLHLQCLLEVMRHNDTQLEW